MFCDSPGQIYITELSMAETSLGPWKYVLNMGGSSHWGLNRNADQEAYGDHYENMPIQ